METDFRKRTVEAKAKRIIELETMIAEAEIEMEKAFNEKKFNILQLHASKKWRAEFEINWIRSCGDTTGSSCPT